MSDSKQMGLVPITHLKETLDRLFGEDVEHWAGWEMETISDTLGVAFDELTRDKIHVLQVLAHYPDMWLEDPSFFLYATDVINNKVADFDSIPMPSSLEMAYSIKELSKLTNTPLATLKQAEEFIDTVAYLLIEEGYSKPLPPFDFVPEYRLTEGQTPADTASKARAIEQYLTHMENL